MDRRKFIRQGALAAAAIAAGPLLGAEQLKILDHVRALTKGRSKTLTLLHPEGCLAGLQPIIALFEKQTNVRINLIETGVDRTNAKILLDHSLKRSSFDLALPATFGLFELATAEAIQSLDTFDQKWRNQLWHQQSRSAKTQTLYAVGDYVDQQHFGMQTDGDAYLMFFNRRIMQDQHIKTAYEDQFQTSFALPQSWQELDQQMGFISAITTGTPTFGGVLFRTAGYMLWEFWLRLHANGSLPVSAEFEPLINSPAGIAALESFLQASSAQHPSSTKNNVFENWEVYAKGQCYCNIGWGGTQKYIHNRPHPPELQNIVTLAPGFKYLDDYIPMSYFNWGWSYVLSSQSTQAELGYLFACFATSPKVSAAAVAAPDGYFDPFLVSHYQAPAVQTAYGEQFLQTHQQAMALAIPDFYVHQQSAYFNALSEAIFLASNQRLSAKEALNHAANKWQVLTLKIGRATQIKRWQHIKAHYPPLLLQHLQK